MALSREKIISHAGSFKSREVHVPAWADENGDDVVLVRGMTLREFEINQGRADNGMANASVIARCVLDANGDRVFTDGDVSIIAELPMAEAQALSEAIAEESGLGGDKPEAKAIADAEGNSETTPGDSSSSD